MANIKDGQRAKNLRLAVTSHLGRKFPISAETTPGNLLWELAYVTECSQKQTLERDYEIYGPGYHKRLGAALLLQTLPERLTT